METSAVGKAAERAGVGTGQLRDRIVARLKAEGRTGRDFPSMARAEQQAVLREAVLGVGASGSAGNTMAVVGKVDVSDSKTLSAQVGKIKDSIRGEEVEHAYVIQADGMILHGAGDATSVSLEGAELAGATVIHNHPTDVGGHVAPGADDYEALVSNPTMRIIAVDGMYDYELSAGGKAFISYNYAYRHGIRIDGDEDQQHNVMEWLASNGYVKYSRKRI